MLNAPSDETRIPAKLKRDKNFQPCPAESGDEHYLNGVSRPILLAEIAPGLYNVIDGDHRLARARRDSAQTVPSAGSVAPITFPSSLPPGRMRSTSSTGIPSSRICHMGKRRANVGRASLRI